MSRAYPPPVPKRPDKCQGDCGPVPKSHSGPLRLMLVSRIRSGSDLTGFDYDMPAWEWLCDTCRQAERERQNVPNKVEHFLRRQNEIALRRGHQNASTGALEARTLVRPMAPTEAAREGRNLPDLDPQATTVSVVTKTGNTRQLIKGLSIRKDPTRRS